MVFRCRPKPNLAAAKKAQVSKPPSNTNETEKQPPPVKDNVDKKPTAATVLAPTYVIKPDTSSPVKAPAPSTSTHDLNVCSSTTGTASVIEIPSENPTTINSVIAISVPVPVARTEVQCKTPITLNSATATSVPDGPIQNLNGPLPSTHAVPRPPAKITADNSLSSVDESESPLFIPQKSQMPLLSKGTPPVDETRPPPVVERTVQSWKAPFEPTIDLDEADNEASDEEKISPTPPRKRKMIEDVLSKPKQKKQRDPAIRATPMIYGPPDRSKVKMRDLIYRHNLTEPPPQYRQERELKQRGRRGCLWMFHNGMPDTGTDLQSSQPAAALDESIKDDKSTVSNSTSSPPDTKPERPEKPEKPEKKPDVKPAQTQFVVNADGTIVVNEDSLVIRREYTDADYIDIKQDGIMGNATYSSYRTKRPRAKKWSVDENVRLYKALSTIGTDFSCMVRLFKNRTREEIKRKFKREEKARPQLIDHVLSNRKSFDLSLLDNPEDDMMPIISDDSDSSSDSDEDVLQKAVLNMDNNAKEKHYRRPKRFKRIDLDPTPMPAIPTWYNSKTAYQPDPPQARRPKPNPARACGVVEEAEAALKRSRAHSMDQPAASPAPAPSPCPSAPGGVEDVLSRLIGQKMRDVNQRPTPPITPVLPPPSPTKSAPLPAPAVRNSALSLTEFCKMEAHVDS